jgi:hypothetical protein
MAEARSRFHEELRAVEQEVQAVGRPPRSSWSGRWVCSRPLTRPSATRSSRAMTRWTAATWTSICTWSGSPTWRSPSSSSPSSRAHFLPSPGPRQSRDLSGSYHRPRWPGLRWQAARIWRRTSAPGHQFGHFATLPGPWTSGQGLVIDDASAVAPSGRRPHQDRARQARPPESTVDTRRAAPAWPCSPAWWAGRSLATRPRAVTPGEPPEDTPARGDQHPARLGVRQGLQMQLLAEARRHPSVHPADLRLALPGVPHPRPAVLQPRRPAVPGARHRADGGGASPAVAGQGDDEGRHCPTRSGP